MEIYYSIVIFIFGIVFGSFYNVVGWRLPKGESLLFPASHCTKCNHKLGASELVPIFSYLFLGGKCKNCGDKISLFYPVFELLTGILFVISYWVFGFSIEFGVALIFISVLLIVFISDYQTMIIPDEVLVFGIICIAILLFIKGGFSLVIDSLINGVISFSIMYLLKKMGDFIFKRESMGGGDIKLMFFIGMTLGFEMAIISIFVASFIGLPISIVIMYLSKDDVIPFGPFLSIAAVILFLFQINFNMIIDLLTK